MIHNHEVESSSLSLATKKIRSGFATPFFVAERRVCYPPPKSPSCEGGDLYFRYINPFCKLYYPFVILQEWVRNFRYIVLLRHFGFHPRCFFLIPTQSNANAGLMGKRWVEDGWKMELATTPTGRLRLTPFPSARRRGASKQHFAISYCVTSFAFLSPLCM